MTTPLGRIERPEVERFRKGRKLYLVPLFLPVPDAPADLLEKLEQYWAGVQEHISRLEAALGPVSRIYHETVFLEGGEGEALVGKINPGGYGLITSRCRAGAHLEATEDRALLEESSDWQRCLFIGLVSQKVQTAVMNAYLEVDSQRYRHIASRIDETLVEDESAILVIGDGHRVQFPADIEVFYIAPPALNDLRRWAGDQSEGGGTAA
jgi:hypothetical protein